MYSPSEDDILILGAAASGDLENLQKLALKIGDEEDFRRKCDVCKDCEGQNSLHYAAGMGTIKMCKFLIEKVKVDIDIKTEKGETPLLLAFAAGHLNTAKYLISRGAEIAISDSKGLTSLHYAAAKDSKELMQMLLLKGADIEANSVDGTPLHFALSFGNIESVRFLLGRGAKPNSVSPFSMSSIMVALSSHSPECLELLLKAGADPNINSFGISPLAYAATKCRAEDVRSLVEAGANPNSLGSDGLTPIEYAALSGNGDVVQILFPVTQSIRNYPDWSIDGLMNYFHSEKAKILIVQRRKAYFKLAKQKGLNAAKRKDYADAVKWYNEAVFLDSSDAILLSNRSLCWALLHEAACALFDAEACVKLRPDWPKSHYREGVAWKLLKNNLMASVAFSKALRLDPINKDINLAFRETVISSFLDLAATCPLESLKIFSERVGK